MWGCIEGGWVGVCATGEWAAPWPTGVCIGVDIVARRFGDGMVGEGIVTERPAPGPPSSGCLRFRAASCGESKGD